MKLCKKPYIVPIPGTRKQSRLTENGKAADIMLTEQEVARLDRALDEMEMSEVFGGTKIKEKGEAYKNMFANCPAGLRQAISTDH